MLNRLSGLRGRLPPTRLFIRAFTQTPPDRRFHVGRFLVIGAAAGTVGGGLIVGAGTSFSNICRSAATKHAKGYAWYRYSGVHHLVERFKPAMTFLGQTNRELGKEAPSHVLKHLRAACKAYVAYLPGAGFLVDKAFDGIDDAVDTHTLEANDIIAEAYQNVLAVVSRNRDAPDGKSAVEIMSIARQLAKDLAALGLKAGQPLAQNLDLENKSAQLKAASAVAFDVAKSKTAEVSQRLAGATEKVKDPRSKAR